MKLWRVVVCALCVSLWAVSAQAVVLHTQDWESRPAYPWGLGGGPSGAPLIDCTITPSPSGGCALKFIYPAGTYSSSFSGGRADYDLQGDQSTIYFGYWLRYSNPFTFNPIGTKMDQLDSAGFTGAPFASKPNLQATWRTTGGGNPSETAQAVWTGNVNITANYVQNVGGAYNIPLNTWVWREVRFTINSPGGADGIYQCWFNGVMVANHTNVKFRDVNQSANLLERFWHTAEWGGGGGTIPVTGYLWVDHTVISTTPIGVPGGAPPPPPPSDTTAPSVPTGLSAVEN